jgi:hypothetical protein
MIDWSGEMAATDLMLDMAWPSCSFDGYEGWPQARR